MWLYLLKNKAESIHFALGEANNQLLSDVFAAMATKNSSMIILAFESVAGCLEGSEGKEELNLPCLTREGKWCYYTNNDNGIWVARLAIDYHDNKNDHILRRVLMILFYIAYSFKFTRYFCFVRYFIPSSWFSSLFLSSYHSTFLAFVSALAFLSSS